MPIDGETTNIEALMCSGSGQRTFILHPSRPCPVVAVADLFGGLAASHLLRLEVLVQEVQCFLVGARAAGNGEHALAGVVVGGLCDRDARAGALADLADLAAATADDAAHHVRGNADVLRLHLFTIFGMRRRRRADGGVRPGSTAVGGG